MNIIKRIILHFISEEKVNYKNVHSTAIIGSNVKVVSPDNLVMGSHSRLGNDAVIMNGPHGEFIIKKNSGIAMGLTAICGNHMPVVGMLHVNVDDTVKKKLDVNHKYSGSIIVDEDVWIGARVTITKGVTIGRGAVVGAGTVVRKNVPPYAVVIGNPAKVVRFRFKLEEIIEHEKKLYSEQERIPEELLKKNYQEYYLDLIDEIKEYKKISL